MIRRQHLGSFGDYTFKLLFIWFSIGVAIISLQKGKWIPTAGGFVRIFVMGFFTLTVVIYAIEHGVDGFPVGDLSPTMAVFLGARPGAALQLRRLRAPERRRRGDDQPAAGRSDLDWSERRHRRAPAT